MKIFEEILKKIEEYRQIIILRHKNPDPDALGSQCGLREILKENYPEKEIFAFGYDEVGLSFMAKMNKLTKLRKPLVIVCDTANRPRIDGLIWKEADFLIKIDHHPNVDPYGNLLYVETKASSVSEIIADFAFSQNLKITDNAARLLYAGIVGDTGRFLYPATTAKTLEIAAKLSNYDFDASEISRKLSTFSQKVALLQGYVYENLLIDKSGAAYIILTQQLLKKLNLKDNDTAAIVGSAGNIEEVKAWILFVEQPDGHYRVRMRSKKVAINLIAERHDGGGHMLASGANAYSLREVDEIWQELKKVVSKN
ncbi:MAG: DHH family phosphoesterase [Lactovum sp.]